MLKYEVKLNDNNIKREKMVWVEKYLSPNLSYVTGVTSSSYHLEKFTKLASTNSIINSYSSLNISECENVKRQGYIVIVGKEYDVYKDSTIDYSIIKSGTTIDYSYIVNKDKYFYWGRLGDSSKSGYTINNLLNYNASENAIKENIYVEANKDDEVIKIDTVYWIENGKVEIDGNVYIFDKNEENGVLKYSENGESLEPSAITRCQEIKYFVEPSEEVTKFKLTKNESQEEEFDKITFASHYYYVKYKNHYCQVSQKYSGDSYQFVCEVPLYVLSAKTEDMVDNLDVNEYPLYFVGEFGDKGAEHSYEEFYNDDFLINSDNIDKHSVYNLNDLKNVLSFIKITEEDAFFNVENDILNANDGTEIIVYLSNVYSPLSEGDEINFIEYVNENNEYIVYNSKDYKGYKSENEEYVIYNSKKYLLEKNLMDKVIINNNEYDIDYINGKNVGENCLVKIGDENVPMLIKEINEDGGTLERYGKIVSSATSASTIAVYNIKCYDGVNINGKKYIVYEQIDEKYAVIDLPKKYTFIISKKIGNSTYLCQPDINATEFTQEFNRMISNVMCSDVVTSQNSYSLFIKNKIFGDKEITKDLAFIRSNSPVSSDDYYDLFNDLSIFINNLYIHIPLALKMNVANNIIQDNIVTHDFFEFEKKKVINPIVDMEKDVYAPKYIYGYYDNNGIVQRGGKYQGSRTIFKPINKINLNFHFRTRNLNSWKINEGNSSYDTSATTDNWFITDFHPYCDILREKRADSAETLMEASDLIGLLYFTNDDIFYQKSKVAKSFARLSFYDSTDPQTQSLLATSCVFVDEHMLFKKYIDNSRKYEMEYGSISEPIFKKNDEGYIIEPKEDEASTEIYKSNKISIDTEFLGFTSAKTKYRTYEEDGVNAKIDDEKHRISSRLVIDNKYVTDTSSEGFYIYMFREYSEKLHPKPIYMKIEFNHAGIGKTIPFLIPMHWDGNKTDRKSPEYNKMHPIRRLTLNSSMDEEELKNGIPLSYVYAQMYIPLYAVYDFEKKEYGYVFDDRYVVEDENGILNLNLFELKIKDESQEKLVERDDPRLIDIKRNQQIKAVINVNTKQFDIKAFNYEVE